MAELSDIQNQTLVDEIEEYLERPEEIERFIELFSAAKPMLQDIAAAIIEGDDDGVDELTTKALESGIEAIEIMDDGLIGGMGQVLGDAGLNIATFHLGRAEAGGDAIGLVSIDGDAKEQVLDQLRALPSIVQVKTLRF